MFSPCYFHVIISIGILESNSLSLSTQSRTKWTLVYLTGVGVVDAVSIKNILAKSRHFVLCKFGV